MLEIKNLKSGYSGTEILHGVNLVVNPGELVALIGPNGAGKSTILKSIFDLAEVYEGKIVFKDKDITGLKTHELIELGISYVPQGRQVFPNMTVLENLQMGAYSIQDQNVVETNIKDVFQKFPDLLRKQQELAGVLSGGQQQMLAIARALIQNPQLLLLDEPSLGLSPKLVKEIFGKISEIKAEGPAILMVEQNARQAVGIADRTYILESGTVALQGDKRILNNKQIEDIYFGGELALGSI
jgi:branched-chain amino acid transport system ATP-binding protein